MFQKSLALTSRKLRRSKSSMGIRIDYCWLILYLESTEANKQVSSKPFAVTAN